MTRRSRTDCIRQIRSLSLPVSDLRDAVTIYWLGFRNSLSDARQIGQWERDRRELGDTRNSIEEWLRRRDRVELDAFSETLEDCVRRGNRDRCYDSRSSVGKWKN